MWVELAGRHRGYITKPERAESIGFSRLELVRQPSHVLAVFCPQKVDTNYRVGKRGARFGTNFSIPRLDRKDSWEIYNTAKTRIKKQVD